MSKMSPKNSEKMSENVTRLTLNSFTQENELNDFFIDFERFNENLSEQSAIIFDGFIVSIFEQGSAEFVINGRNYRVAKGDILLLAPNMLLKTGDFSADYKATKIVVPLDVIMDFPTPLDTDIIGMARRRPLMHLAEDDLSSIFAYFDLIVKNYSEHENAYRKEILKSLFYALMLKIGSIYKRLDADTDARLSAEKLSDDFLKLLSLHYKKQRTVKFYADKMHLTPKYLSKAIRKITGKSITSWIDDAILLEIKIQLKTTELTVWQIAEDLSFSSSSALVQFFKKNTGTTPLKYRKIEQW